MVYYIVRSTERTRSGGSENETCSLLYMMNFYCHRNEIHYFVIDLFNDLTCVSENFEKAFDVQSKKARSNATDIGNELVTLYKNYLSELFFSDYILFVGSIKNNLLNNKTLTEFGFRNFTNSAQNEIKNGLKDACYKKEYINDIDIDDHKISKFLRKVHFVINSRSEVEYIKSIVDIKKSVIDDEVFKKIFNSLKIMQSSKKETLVEGQVIHSMSDFLDFGRHFTKEDIKKYILNLLLNYNWCSSKNMPICMNDVFGPLDSEECRDIMDNFLQCMCLTLNDTNNNKNFWKLFGEIYYFVNDCKMNDPLEIYEKINKNVVSKNHHFNKESILVFICIFVEGVFNDSN